MTMASARQPAAEKQPRPIPRAPEALPPSPTRHDFIHIAAAAFVTIGAAAALWPLIASMNPAADVLAEATVTVNLSPIEVGQRITVNWRGKPIFIDHRPPEEIALARAVPLDELPDPEPDEARVKRAEWLVAVGICTHLGCVPRGQAPRDQRGSYGGWYCPCHGSEYDTSARIRKGPAPRNLEIPPYRFLSETEILIG